MATLSSPAQVLLAASAIAAVLLVTLSAQSKSALYTQVTSTTPIVAAAVRVPHQRSVEVRNTFPSEAPSEVNHAVNQPATQASSLGALAAAGCAGLFAFAVALGRWGRQGPTVDALQPLTLHGALPAQPWTMATLAAGKPLEGKVALVTGATRGIGAAIARSLGEAGATVIGTATSEAGATAITEAFASQGVTGQGMLLDVTNEEMIKEAVKTIGDKYGAPTIIVNNAGITKDKLLLQMKDEDWDSVILTNLTSVFRITKAFQRGLSKAKWGRIISISSVVGSSGNMGQCNYASAKAGIEGFTKSVAREMATRGVTVNAVAPGFIETDMTKDLPEEWAEKLKANIPMGRMGSSEDVANAVLFLALPSSSYITGQTLHVNGGMYMN